MNVSRWSRLILRWASVDTTPEVHLIVAILANAIEDERYRFIVGPKYTTGFFDKYAGFFVYCKAIGVNPEFLQTQIQIAADYEAYGRGK